SGLALLLRALDEPPREDLIELGVARADAELARAFILVIIIPEPLAVLDLERLAVEDVFIGLRAPALSEIFEAPAHIFFKLVEAILHRREARFVALGGLEEVEEALEVGAAERGLARFDRSFALSL